MGASYHQFCPVAKAMELLDERWTLLVVRELAAGSERFNELRRGLPRMSPTLLSRRLQQLIRAGIVDKTDDGNGVRYRLSPAGGELRPIVAALGAWGVRWIGRIGDADLDPKLLLWDIRRHVDGAAVPPGRTVIAFEFPDVPAAGRRWWLVVTPDDADVCDTDPGYPVALTVTATLRHLTEVWLGERTWAQAGRAGDLTLVGTAAARRGLPRWLTLSTFAAVPRPRQAVDPEAQYG
jgi:DNA-binding HxlR family transcriptional regulator